MHEIGERYDLPPRDGFDLTVHLESDVECNAYDFERHYTKADLTVWGYTWRFVGVMVEASQDGTELGHAVLWMQHHGVMGAGKVCDALGRSGPFSGVTRERLINQAVLEAVHSVRRQANVSYDNAWDVYETPVISRTSKPSDSRYPWTLTWPNRQITTYRSRAAANEAALVAVRILWIEATIEDS